jgi:dipeptidyl aminopeptidase/acylaminoacyl peptidase
LASPRAGWIAAWGTETRPELVLVNPLTGETCSLITFNSANAPRGTATPEGPRDWIPQRGQLAWSPDGEALAFVVVDAEPCCRYALYVWSDLGLAGPIIEIGYPSYLHVPSWSPDGSLLAVGESTGRIPGALDPASAWIIAGDGSAPREVHADCVACFGGSVYWSPNGDQIAFRTWSNQDNGESLGIAAGGVDDQVVPLLSSTSGGDALLGWASEESLWAVRFGVTVPVTEPDGAGHLFEVPLDPRLDPVDHGFPPAGPGVSPGGVAISPDGTQVLQVVERPRAFPIGDLMLADFPTGHPERLIEGLASAWGPVWWSPDGRTIGYLVDVQTPDQGIWLVNADGTGVRRLVGGSLVIGRDVYGLDDTLLKVWQPRP